MLFITVGSTKPHNWEGVVGWEIVSKFEENNDTVFVIFILYYISHNRWGSLFPCLFEITLEMHLYKGKWDSQNSVITKYIRFYVAKTQTRFIDLESNVLFTAFIEKVFQQFLHDPSLTV